MGTHLLLGAGKGSAAAAFGPLSLSPTAYWPVTSTGVVVEAGSRQFTMANSEYADTPDHPDWRPQDEGWWSAGWTYADTVTLTAAMWAQWDSANPNWRVEFNNGPANIRFRAYDALSTNVVVDSGIIATSGQWYFIIVYHDPVDNEIAISVDGAAFVTAALSGGVRELVSKMTVARHPSSVFHNGRIARLAFGKYPTSQMSSIAATIRDALYNGGLSAHYDDLTSAQKTDWGLTHWYECDEEVGDLLDSHGSINITEYNTVTAADGPDSLKVEDESTNSNHGTITGTSGADIWTQDVPANAITGAKWSGEFNGTDDYVDCGNINDAPATFTLSAWVKTTDTNAGIIGRWNGLGYFLWVSTSGKLSCPIDAGPHVTSTAAINDGAWHHVAARHDGASITLYIDGSADGTQAESGPSATAQVLEIGTYDRKAANTLSGTIHDARVYNADIGATEIANLAAGTDYTTNLVGQWLGPTTNGPGSAPSDQDPVIFVRDTSGNGNLLQQLTAAKRTLYDSGTFTNPVLTLDATDDKLDSGLTPSGNEFTFAAWVYADDLSAIATIMSAEDGSNEGLYIDLQTSGKIQVGIDSDSDATYQADEKLTTTGTVSVTTWTHVAVTCTTGGLITVYLDGVADATTLTLPESTLNWGGTIVIGSRGNGSNYWDGSLAALYFNQAAESAADVASLASVGDPT